MMVGYSVTREPNGVIIYKDGKETRLNQDECNKLASLIWLSQRQYWKEVGKK